ncbi:hypothetical protein [Mixta sp. Marseille-Q2659]|nr:hypothetical protein [Mixta sp. Marseille-Q2659]
MNIKPSAFSEIQLNFPSPVKKMNIRNFHFRGTLYHHENKLKVLEYA